jgi:hypothetical protein
MQLNVGLLPAGTPVFRMKFGTATSAGRPGFTNAKCRLN